MKISKEIVAKLNLLETVVYAEYCKLAGDINYCVSKPIKYVNKCICNGDPTDEQEKALGIANSSLKNKGFLEYYPSARMTKVYGTDSIKIDKNWEMLDVPHLMAKGLWIKLFLGLEANTPFYSILYKELEDAGAIIDGQPFIPSLPEKDLI